MNQLNIKDSVISTFNTIAETISTGVSNLAENATQTKKNVKDTLSHGTLISPKEYQEPTRFQSAMNKVGGFLNKFFTKLSPFFSKAEEKKKVEDLEMSDMSDMSRVNDSSNEDKLQ